MSRDTHITSGPGLQKAAPITSTTLLDKKHKFSRLGIYDSTSNDRTTVIEVVPHSPQCHYSHSPRVSLLLENEVHGRDRLCHYSESPAWNNLSRLVF